MNSFSAVHKKKKHRAELPSPGHRVRQNLKKQLIVLLFVCHKDDSQYIQMNAIIYICLIIIKLTIKIVLVNICFIFTVLFE